MIVHCEKGTSIGDLKIGVTVTPLFKGPGTASNSTTAFRIHISYVTMASPLAFRCSAISLSGHCAFFAFSLLIALETSSMVNGTSSRQSSSRWDDTSQVFPLASTHLVLKVISPYFQKHILILHQFLPYHQFGTA